ncbi:MATE family efflux transporter [Cohnella zeiphila]|uniref:MATE family efflux transporter n=1 Tax=Cohnella zeiphila TaxID=2761120 RepID=A0A7X0VUM1_9BACL|nr:MATE family efflux transporter [Cohnella zeiphila]MBB6731139.1 MATE family efflux transporter [Cohnella zeiphila]
MSIGALAWPVMIEMFLQFAIGRSDTLMVSRISDDAVAVVGFSNQFFNAVMVLFMLVSSGAGILIAQRLGAGMVRDARVLGTMAIVLTGGIGLAVSLTVLLGAGWFADILQVPREIQPMAAQYMSIVGGGMIFTALGTAFSTCIRNTGDTRSPMLIAFGMNIVHMILNGLFIFGALGFPKWGLFGVALSTLFVRLASAVLLLHLFRRAFGGKIAWREFPHFEPKLLKEIFRIGWPLSVNGASWTFSQLAIFSIIGLMGAQSLAARTYMNSMESFAFTIGWSIALAVQILVAYQFGSGKLKEAYFSCYRALWLGELLVLVNTGLILLFRRQVISFFTGDPWIVDMAISLLWLNLALQPGKMLNMAIGQSLNAIGDSRFMMSLSLPSQWIVSVGLSYTLGVRMGWGLYGVYAGMILDEWLRGVILLYRWRRHRRKGLFASVFGKKPPAPVSAPAAGAGLR